MITIREKWEGLVRRAERGIRDRGLPFWLARQIARVVRFVYLDSFLMVAAWLFKRMRVRFLSMRHLHAIGHLSFEPECYVMEEKLGVHPAYMAIVLAPSYRVCNRHLLSYWRRYLRVITSPVVCNLLKPLAERKEVQFNTDVYSLGDPDAARHFSIYAQWGDRPPLLRLRMEDRERGRVLLRNLGLPEGAWFVCVHAREFGSQGYDDFHLHRNVDIGTYGPAMEAIAEKGGWCIRVGNSKMIHLPQMRHVVDFAHYKHHEEWMDVFLLTTCRFFLGCSSGPSELPGAFGVPGVRTNTVPMGVLASRPHDLGIPKLMWSTREDRMLTFPEVMNSPISTYLHDSRLFHEAGIRIIDNTAEEIRELALEMLETLEGTLEYTPEDKRRQRCFKSLLKPNHYAYGTGARVGRDFLRRHEALLTLPGERQESNHSSMERAG